LLEREAALQGRRKEHPGFQSFKTTHRINYRGRWPRDALIQMTLDRTIDAISPFDASPFDAEANLAVCVTQGDRRAIVIYNETRDAEFTPPNEYHVGRFVPRQQVHREPLFTLCRTIWACRDKPVSAKALTYLFPAASAETPGYQPITSLPEHELTQLFALACRGIIELDWGNNPLTELTARCRTLSYLQEL
jgi:hypothetical protein